METINAATSSGMTARLFKNLRVGGEALFEPQQGERSPSRLRGEALHPHHRAGLKRGVEAPSLAARPEKKKEPEQVQAPTTAAAFSYQRAERTTLFLTTQQGDTVELKIRNQSSTDAALREFDSGDTLLSQFSLQSKDSSRLSLVIKGDLNSDELEAIRSVVDQVSVMAQKFFAGNVADAFATAERFNMDGDQLADVAIGMRVEERLTYTQSNLSPALAPALPDSGGDLQTSGALEPAAATAVPPSALSNPIQAPAPRKAGIQPPSVAPAAATNRAQLMHEALNLIGDFLKGLMDKLQQPAPGEKLGDAAPVGVALKLKLFKSVVTAAQIPAAPAQNPPAPLPALVGDTLDALSAKHEPPLKTVV